MAVPVAKRRITVLDDDDEACVPESQPLSSCTLGSSTPNHGHEDVLFSIDSDMSSVSAPSPSRKHLKAARLNTSKTTKSKVCTNPADLNRVHRLSADSYSESGSSTLSWQLHQTSSNSSSPSTIFFGSDDEEDIPARKRTKRVNKGKDWNLYKPSHEHRLYTYIVNNPDNASEIAKKWVITYINDSKPKAVIAFLQLLVDVCGYPQFDITRKFDYDKENYKEVMNFMQEHPPEIHQKGKYLIRGTSEWCKQTHTGIFEFIKNVIYFAHESTVLYDYVMIRYIVGFPVVLNKSNNRSIFQTGASIVIIMYTALLDIQKQLMNKTSTPNDNSLKIVSSILKNMQSIVERSCTINDNSVYGIRVLFCEEVWKWFKRDPECIKNTKFFKRLLGCICDPSVGVRRAALNTCHKLVETIKFIHYIADEMKDFTKSVAGRVKDVDHSVAISAIKICTSMLKTYPNEISHNYCNTIVKLIYYNHYGMAVAAGKFTIEMLDSGEDKDQPNLRIEQLVKIYITTKTENAVPVFVEALLHNCPELQEWQYMVDLLMSDTLNNAQQVVLVDIFCQSISQIVTGKSKYLRKKTPVHGYMKASRIKNVVHITLLNLHRLLVKFSTEPKCVQLLTELMSIIDFNHISTKHLKPVIDIIHNILKRYTESNDLTLLETTSKLLIPILDEHCPIKQRLEGFIMNFVETVCSIFLENMDCMKEVDEIEPEFAKKLEHSFLMLSVLFVDHDLTELISCDIFNEMWSTLKHSLPPKCMNHLIKIRCWHLIWQFKVIIQNGSKAQPEDELQQEIRNLKMHCNDYLQKCLELIKKPNPLSDMAYQCISDILLKFFDISNSIRSNQVLKELIPTFNESSQEIFTMFTIKQLFGNTFKSPLKQRRIILGNIINIIFLGAINITQLPKMCVYYNSYHEAYGDIFTGALLKLHVNCEESVVGLVLQSLTYKFEKMMGNAPNFTLDSEHCIGLAKLAEQFLLPIKKNFSELKLILQLGINFSLSSVPNYTFLHFIKCFAMPLSMEDKKRILVYFNENLPEENKNHEAILSFAAYLKKSNVKAAAKNPSKSTSSITSISSIDIPESDDINDIDTDYDISDFSDGERN